MFLFDTTILSESMNNHYNNYPVWRVISVVAVILWLFDAQHTSIVHVFWCPRQTQHLRPETSFRPEDHTDWEKAYEKDAFHNWTISLQVFKMLTTGQLQLLRLQRVNQNAAVGAMMMYRWLIRRRRRQYWLRPWIARRSLFLELLRSILNSPSDLFEHLLRNETVMRRQVGDVCKPIEDKRLAHAWKPLCNWPPTSPIDHRLIADQSQIGRRYIAKISARFVVKLIAAPTKTDLRVT